NRVLAIERLDRPAVRGAHGAAVRDSPDLGEGDSRPFGSRRRRSAGCDRAEEGGNDDGGGDDRPATPADMGSLGGHGPTVERGPNRPLTARKRPPNGGRLRVSEPVIACGSPP